MKISQKLLITFITLLIIPVSILAILSGIQIILLSEENSNDSAKALKTDSLEQLQRMVQDEGIFVNETFKQWISEVKMLDNYTEVLFNNEINITPQHTYYWDKVLENTNSGLVVPGLINNYNYDPPEISWDVSCYFLPREYAPTPANPFDLSLKMQTILNASSNMDNAFKSLHAANTNYVWIYAGFEGEGHLFRNYPYNNLEYFLDYYDDGTDYDPLQEEWYTTATTLLNETASAFISPYWDPAVGLIISITRPMRYQNGTLFGVVGADITITSIVEEVLGISFLDNGYAFLLGSDGSVIAHPELDQEAEELPSIGELEFINMDEQNSFESSIVSKMTQGLSGTDSFLKNGKSWFISYAPITVAGYSLGIMVPESDIIASAVQVRETISGLTVQQTFLFAVILIIILTLVVVVGSIISNRIVQPVNELTRMVNFIAEGDLSRDLRSSASSMGKEVATLHSAFDNLLTSLRFGNTDYYRGDLKRAYQNYKKAHELFTTTKNERGIAIATNNLGNIYRAWGDFDKAKEAYFEAIRIGDIQKDKRGLASRFNNLGILYLDKKDYKLALQMLETAKQYDEETSNVKGLITRLGNIGIVYERLEDKNKAEKFFKEAMNLAEKNNDTRGLANTYLTYAIFFMGQGKYKESLEYLLKSFDLAKSIDDVRLALHCLERLSTAYEELDQPTDSHKARISAEMIRKKIMHPKMALFVLDYSGSMEGQKIRSAVRGATKLFEGQINPQDKVGIVIFNNQSRTILPLTQVEGNEKNILRKIKELRYPSGMTAFYDALGDALNFLNKEKGNEQKWLIALTDGEDNSSERFSILRHGRRTFEFFTKLSEKIGVKATSIPDFIDENLLTINIAIVGVGEEVRRIARPLQELCNATPRGRYIDVSKPSTQIERAIEEAFEEIKDAIGQVDVEGFDVSED
ncbi:tetratricopeptide repeat protein [Candidatus Hodarchaeum mangrovi]